MGPLERVYGDVDYYDGIVLVGVADFHGAPHAFEVDGDMYEEFPIYRLAPIADPSMVAAMEWSRPWVDPGSELKVRGRFLSRDESRRAEDGPWALDVGWLER